MTDLRSALLSALDADLLLAEKATPGPWDYNGYSAIRAMGLPDEHPMVVYKAEDGEPSMAEIAGIDDLAACKHRGDLRCGQAAYNGMLIARLRSIGPLALKAIREQVQDAYCRMERTMQTGGLCYCSSCMRLRDLASALYPELLPKP